MSEIRGYRDLRVWQAGMDVVVQIYCLTERFPRSELYGLASQLQRAAVSVPANLAEGHTRDHIREYAKHVAIARGSLAEVETHLEIAVRLGYLSPSEVVALNQEIAALGRQLTALRESLNRRIDRLELDGIRRVERPQPREPRT